MDMRKETKDETIDTPAISEKEKVLAKKVIFDIVSSVKGGSGKSTYSLLLAAYYNAQPNTIAYVLDLDLRGTSWEKNYGAYINTGFFESQDKNSLSDYYNASCEEDPVVREQSKEMRKRYIEYPFINSLMWNFSDFKGKEFWSKIEYRTESKENIIPLCPACVKSGSEIDQLEVEIFEHTIAQIILHILNRHRDFDDPEKKVHEVHIIMDMPPNYESHAEAVVKHLLTNEGSKLFQMAKNRDDCFDVNPKDPTAYYLPFQIHLFMLCAISPAHLEQNSYYLYCWLKDRKYSDGVVDLLKDDTIRVKVINPDSSKRVDQMKCNRFQVSFILNDIMNILPNLFMKDEPSNTEIAEWAKSVAHQRETDNSSYYTQVKSFMDGLVKDGRGSPVILRAFPHLLLPATYWYWSTGVSGATPPRPPLKIDQRIADAIKNSL